MHKLINGFQFASQYLLTPAPATRKPTAVLSASCRTPSVVTCSPVRRTSLHPGAFWAESASSQRFWLFCSFDAKLAILGVQRVARSTFTVSYVLCLWSEKRAVFKRQVINLRNCCIWLVDSDEITMMQWLANRTLKNKQTQTIKCVSVQFLWPKNKKCSVQISLQSVVQFVVLSELSGYAVGSAVGWGTALQVGRSRVWLPMLSLEFFIDTILPAALWPWGWLNL
jgi:hypothetical protein